MSITLNATEEELRRIISLEHDSCENDYEFNRDYNSDILTLRILDAETLCTIADRERYRQGLKPAFPFDNLTDADCDPDGYYSFYINFDASEPGYIDSYINVYEYNFADEMPDGDFCCEIYLPEAIRLIIYEILDEQVRLYYDRHIEDALFEDRESDPAL